MKKLQKTPELFKEISRLIEQSKRQLAVTVNSAISELYWHIGKTISRDMLQNKRAEYGKQIVANLSKQLTEQYGRGWSEKQLRHCLYFVEIFPDYKIISTLWRELT
jgi:phosphoribosylformimino-5-aminoimidazole carboxamide ribonucleotide (ProFAR) isomerase